MIRPRRPGGLYRRPATTTAARCGRSATADWAEYGQEIEQLGEVLEQLGSGPVLE